MQKISKVKDFRILNPDYAHGKIVDMIILNRPIVKTVFDQFRTRVTRFVICADGGANRLLAADPSLKPDYIIGDLDSLLPATRTHYESMGTTVKKSDCQDTTDLQKCLNFV